MVTEKFPEQSSGLNLFYFITYNFITSVICLTCEKKSQWKLKMMHFSFCGNADVTFLTLFCTANQRIGFCVIGTSVMKELKSYLHLKVV